LIVVRELKPDQKPTDEQIARIREAAKRPVEFDEDCPEADLELLRKAVHERNLRLKEKGTA
jgi:hypothetical protein